MTPSKVELDLAEASTPLIDALGDFLDSLGRVSSEWRSAGDDLNLWLVQFTEDRLRLISILAQSQDVAPPMGVSRDQFLAAILNLVEEARHLYRFVFAVKPNHNPYDSDDAMLLRELRDRPPVIHHELRKLVAHLIHIEALRKWMDVVPPDPIAGSDRADRSSPDECRDDAGGDAVDGRNEHLDGATSSQMLDSDEINATSTGKGPQGETPLAERELLVLVALLELGATDPDSRRPLHEIVAKAAGAKADSNTYKSVMVSLRNRGFVRSKTGRSGGSYLTQVGRDRAVKLADRFTDKR